jgi:hypothetical protein
MFIKTMNGVRAKKNHKILNIFLPICKRLLSFKRLIYINKLLNEAKYAKIEIIKKRR